MNTIITGKTNPAIRFKIQGIYLCRKLNKHLIVKRTTITIIYILYLICLIINDVSNNRLQSEPSEETWGQYTTFI